MAKAKQREPIYDFKTKEALIECAKEWQHRLFLDHWYIEYGLVNGEDIPGMAGLNEAVWDNCAGSVSIRKMDQMPSTILNKHQEITLVHELLHFKYLPFEEVGGSTIEGGFYTTMQHQILEQMAKSLIMAKYDLDPSWFQKHFSF